MAVVADEGEVVDVGFALIDGFPRQQMVCHTLCVVCAALDASSVSGDEPVDLGWRGEPFASALPEEFAVAVEDVGNDVSPAHDLVEDGSGEWLAIGSNDR